MSAPIQAAVDNLILLLRTKQFSELLDKSLAVLKAAVDANDLIGQGSVRAARANAFDELNRPMESAAEFRAAAESFAEAGEGPFQAGALSEAAFVLFRTDASEAEKLLAKALKVASQETKRPSAAASVLYHIGRHLYTDTNDHTDLAKTFLESAVLMQRTAVPSSPDLADSLVMLGVLEHDSGALQSAFEHLAESLAIREKLDPSDTDIAVVLYNLGNVEVDRGDVKSAIQHFDRAAVIFEQRGTSPADLARTLNRLGLAYVRLKDWSAAKGNLSRAADLLRRAAPGSAKLAEVLHNLGSTEKELSDLVSARQHYEEAAALFEKTEPGSENVATANKSLGSVAWAQRDLPAAESYYKRALDVERKLGQDSLAVAAILSDLGDVVTAEPGDLSLAEDYLRRAEFIREKQVPESKELAHNLASLANTLGIEGKFAEAIEILVRAIAILDRIEHNSLDVADVTSQLAETYSDRGDLERAGVSFQKASSIQEKGAPDSLNLARTLNGLGIVAMDRGDVNAAGDYYSRAGVIAQKSDPKAFEAIASLNGLGGVAYLEGNFQSSAGYYQQALDIEESFKNRPLHLLVATLNGLALAYQGRGDRPRAEEYLRRALTIQEQRGKEYMEITQTLTNLGVVLDNQGKFAEAEEYERRLLAILDKSAPESVAMATALLNLSKTMIEKDEDPSSSELYVRRATEIDKRLAPNSLEYAATLEALGVLAERQSHSEKAESNFRSSLTIKERVAPDSIEVAETLTHLSNVRYDLHDLAGAQDFAQRAWDIVRSLAGTISSDEGRQVFSATLALYAGQLAALQIARREFAQAFLTLEHGRAQALGQLLAQRRVLAGGSTKDLWSQQEAVLRNVIRTEIELRKAQEELAFDSAAGANGTSTGELKGALVSRADEARVAYLNARLQADQLWESIQHSAPNIVAPAIDMEQAGRVLPEGTVFASFSVNVHSCLVFILYRDQDGRVVAEPGFWAQMDKSTRQLVEPEVEKLRRLITDKESDLDSIASASRWLFTLLFPGRAGDIVLKAKRLLISPDGPLWGLPFAALVVNDKGPPEYLGDRVAISYTQSFRTFQQSRTDPPRLAPGEPPLALVVGNPLFDRERAPTPTASVPERGFAFVNGQAPKPLPASKEEAQDVAALYRSNPLMDSDATEAEVRKRIQSADVIHLATHAILHPSVAMASGVLLAQPAQQTAGTNDDGILQAWEIFSELKLRAELVVLSACQTALGKTIEAEGVVGLTRAFQYAGARSVVASQWSVEDKSTAALMVAFHSALRRGLPKDEALRQAIRKVREDPRRSHPYYWAAFILLGDPENPNLASP